MNNEKKLRDFIKSHEMRYFTSYNDYSGQTKIKKAFKVVVDNVEVWVHFRYGDMPTIVSEKNLLKTIEEATKEAEKLRDEHKKKKKEAAENSKAKMAEVTGFLDNFSWYDYADWKTDEIKPPAQPFAKAITDVYARMPRRAKDDDITYIKLLERYIQTGVIYTQALSFRKEHVVSVKYGADGSVMVELVNKEKIIPKSKGVTKLIRAIFGDRLDTWSYDDVKEPTDEHDKIV